MSRNVWTCFVSTALTHILLNALHALIFVSTVSTNNIAYTIQYIACFDLCIDSVDKQHMQSNYNVDSNNKVFELHENLIKRLD